MLDFRRYSKSLINVCYLNSTITITEISGAVMYPEEGLNSKNANSHYPASPSANFLKQIITPCILSISSNVSYSVASNYHDG